MTKSRVTLSISVLCVLCLVCIVLLLEEISVNQSSTLEQMLSEQDIVQIDQYREMFDVESEPVIVAIQAPVQLTAARIADIEKSLLSIPAVSNTLSSASIERFGADRAQMFSPNDSTELIVLMISPDSQQLAAAKSLLQEIKQTIDTQLEPDDGEYRPAMPGTQRASPC